MEKDTPNVLYNNLQSILLDSSKCFLCINDFKGGDKSWYLFEDRVRNGQLDCSLSQVIASALDRNELDHSVNQANYICDTCHSMVCEYEKAYHMLDELRHKIVALYNLTSKNLIEFALTNDTQESIVLEEPNEHTTNEEYDYLEETLEGSDNGDKINDIDYDNYNNNGIYNDNDNITNNEEDCNSNMLNSQIMSIDLKNKLPSPKSSRTPKKIYIFETDDMELHDVKIDESDLIEYDQSLTEENVQFTETTADLIPIEINIIPEPNAIPEDDLINIDVVDEQIEKTTTKDSTINVDVDVDVDVDIDVDVDVDVDVNADVNVDADLNVNVQENEENRVFVCEACDGHKTFNKDALVQHMQTVHNTKVYICSYCNDLFVRRRELNIHVENNHREALQMAKSLKAANNLLVEKVKLECDVCKVECSSLRHLKLHKRSHLIDAPKNFECKLCLEKFSTQKLLKTHSEIHDDNRPFKCTQCPKDFTSNYSLNAHLKIHTNRERPFKCHLCTKAFYKEQNLIQHQQVHSGVKKFACDVCNKYFSTFHNMELHKIVHTGLKPFKCDVCEKSFARRAEIRDHERVHTGERPFKCDLCSLAFAQRSNLVSHKKSTHLNQRLHNCVTCNRSFKRRRLLDYHIQIMHTGERPFSCTICSATFVYPEHFKKHMLIHSGNKPFACEVCDKKFYSCENRNTHRFTHSDKKPYECLECGMGFMRIPMLVAHMKAASHTSDTIIVNRPHIRQALIKEEFTEDINNELPEQNTTISTVHEVFEVVNINNDHKIIAEEDLMQNENLVDNFEKSDDYLDEKYLQFSGNSPLPWIPCDEDGDITDN